MTEPAELEPAELEPAQGPDIARALGANLSLTQRMARTAVVSFDNQPDMAALYQDIFDSLLLEAETVPGFNTGMAMLLERYAFVWATQKAADLMENPLHARDYDQLIMRFRQLWDGILKARDDRQADDQFKHAFITAVMRAITEVAEAELGTEAAQDFGAKVVAKLRAIEVQGTESRRRN